MWPALRTLRTLVLVGFLPLLGCSAGAADSLAPVKGKVYYRGVPLSSGVIAFTPDAHRGTSGSPAHAEIQPDGTYELRSGPALGAIVGWHRVTVAAVEMPRLPPGQRYAPVRSLVPDKYRDPDLSGLLFEVKAGQLNGIDVHLE